jgi:hypothetical protein
MRNVRQARSTYEVDDSGDASHPQRPREQPQTESHRVVETDHRHPHATHAMRLLATAARGRAERATPSASEAGWWVYEREGAFLADAQVYTEGANGPAEAGARWTLEYVLDGGKTFQIVAFDRDSGMRDLVEKQETVGSADVQGTRMKLRRSKAVGEFPASVGADWTEGQLLIQFGGRGVSEADLRGHLRYLKRVDRTRFDAEVAKANRPPTTPLPT